MTSVETVLNFYEENKELLPKTIKPHLIKQAIESGLITATELLNKLKNKINKEVETIPKWMFEEPEPTKEDLNKNEETIKNIIINHDIKDKSLSIWFKRGSKTSFKSIKETVYNKLNEYKTLDNNWFRLFMKVNGEKRRTDFSLNNERGIILLTNLLKGDNFELLSDINNDATIEVV